MKKIIFLCIFTTAFSYCSNLDIKIKNSKNLTPNLTYSTYDSTDFPLIAHVIKLPLNSLNIKLIPALGQREETSSIAQRSGAFIAINGSNYRRGGKYNGSRVNLFYLENQIFADLNFIRGSFGWNNNLKSAIFDKIFLDKHFYVNDNLLPIDSINQPRSLGQSVLYNHLADIYLLKHTPGKNIIINNSGFVEDIAYEIPKQIFNDWFIYQVDKNSLNEIKKGDKTRFNFEIKSSQTSLIYNNYDFILAGAGLLIKDEKIVADQLYDEFSQGNAVVHSNDEIAADFHEPDIQKWMVDLRHPRTAIGITNNNEICIAVVDGRQKESDGLNLKELAIFMKQLGCVNALNIGGGGCSTLYIDGKVVNNPSDKAERPVSEGICFFVN